MTLENENTEHSETPSESEMPEQAGQDEVKMTSRQLWRDIRESITGSQQDFTQVLHDSGT